MRPPRDLLSDQQPHGTWLMAFRKRKRERKVWPTRRQEATFQLKEKEQCAPQDEKEKTFLLYVCDVNRKRQRKEEDQRRSRERLL